MAAGLRTFAKVAEASHFAVSSTGHGVAEVDLLSNTARNATVAGVLDDLSGTPPVTSSAGAGAVGPLVPRFLDAVDRAWCAVAVPVLGVDLRALSASAFHCAIDGAEPLADAEVTAGLVAGSPVAEFGD